jgi:hypothetical protein|tara:strand:+ start:85 stop:1482 length:1398 start_codon:yes stop_codon:yes gene_type:complete
MKIKLPEIKLKGTGLTNLFDVDNHIRKLLGPVINQVNRGKADEGELAEVIKVYSTEDQLEESPINDEPDYKLIGAIRFRKIYSQQNLSDDQLMIAYPLNLNIVDFPVRGETVFIQKIYDKFYYTDRVNIYNNPNNSSAIGSSQKFNVGKIKKSKKTLDTAESGVVEDTSSTSDVFLGEYFRPNFNIRSLIPNEGDTLIQGRFGNTIRLGSVDNAPTIKLRAGQISDFEKFDEGDALIEELSEKAINTSLEENINLDASSMWMTTDETVSLTPATLEDPNIYPTEVAPAEFSGKQIILNSGRLIFNSKESGILGFSNGPIDFSTLNSFGVAAKQDLNLYSPTIVIGREDKTKNISLLGKDFYLQNEKGITAIISKGIELGVDFAQQEPAVKGDTLEEILSELMDVVSDLSSAVATIVTTPITIGVLATPTPQPYAREASRAYQALSSLATLSIKLNTMKSRVVTLQ